MIAQFAAHDGAASPRRWIRRSAAGLLAVLVCTTGMAQPASRSAVDPAQWAPTDAIAYVGITDIEQAWEAIQKSAGYRMVQDPAVREVAGEFNLLGLVAQRLKDRIAKALEVQPDQLRSPFGGPVTLYLAAASGAKWDAVHPVLVAGVKDAALMKSYHEKAVARLRTAADKYETVSAGSNTIDTFTRSSKAADEGDKAADDDELNEEDLLAGDETAVGGLADTILDELFSAEAMPEKLAICVTDARLIVAQTADEIQTVLRRERGESSLADNDDHKVLLRQFRPTGVIRFLVNLPRMIEMARADGDSETQKTLTMLGARCLRGFVGHIAFGGDEAWESRSDALLLMSGERTGIAKVLSMTNRAADVPAPTPPDAAIGISVNLTPRDALDEFERTLRQVDAEAAEQMHASLEKIETPSGEALHVRRDLIDRLVGPLTMSISFVRPLEPTSVRLLLSMAHNDRVAMEKSLSLIPMTTSRDVRGSQVFDLSFGGVSMAATNNVVLFGATAAVESSLQSAGREARGLADEPSFRKLASLAPNESWCTAYVDGRSLTEAALAFARQRDALMAQAGMMNIGAMFALGIAEGMFPDATAEKLESAGRILEYQAASIMTVSTTSEGLQLTQIQMRPTRP